MKALRLSVGAVVLMTACAHDAPTGVTKNLVKPPALIELDSLRGVDGSAVPCCGVSGGALSFYYPVRDTPTVETPGAGVLPRACVIGVPNGVLINPRGGWAIAANGDTIPMFGCTDGEYNLTTQSLSGGHDSVVSAGYFTWTADSLWHSGVLVLADSTVGDTVTLTLTGLTASVPLAGHTYAFHVVHGF